MSTHGLTVFLDEDRTEIAVLYRQSDSYPSGHGQQLKNYLVGLILDDGLSIRETRRTANGMSCLACQVIGHFKFNQQREYSIGTPPTYLPAVGFYLYPAGTRDVGECYIYTIYPKKGKVWMKVEYTFKKKILFNGKVEAFDPEKVQE